jgi:hypothetical protein
MDGAVTSFDQFCLPDMIWERMQNILPKYRKSRKGGRPRKELRRVPPFSIACAPDTSGK